jgi:DNA-binding response OmpR family regulator
MAASLERLGWRARAEAPSAQQMLSARVVRAKAKSKACRVLLVEDESPVAELYATVLKLHGHDVRVAPDGLAGLEAIRSGGFDLILVDIRMPRMDGLAMLRTVVAEETAIGTPVVILTNYDDVIFREEARNLGARDYLLKSRTMPQQLASLVSTWCH